MHGNNLRAQKIKISDSVVAGIICDNPGYERATLADTSQLQSLLTCDIA
jgi:hypothetical protein